MRFEHPGFMRPGRSVVSEVGGARLNAEQENE